jgi:hypothetical protein
MPLPTDLLRTNIALPPPAGAGTTGEVAETNALHDRVNKIIGGWSTRGPVVAPALAAQAIKNTADYVCDGTNDQVEILAALATGYKPLLLAGAYDLGAALAVNDIDWELEGMGPRTQLRFNSATVPIAIKMADTTQRRFSLRNLRISHSGTGNGGTAIDASHFVNSAFSGLLIDGTSGATNSPSKGVVYNASDTFYNVILDSRIEVAGSGSQGLVYDALANSNVARNIRIVPGSGSVGVLVDAQAIYLDHVDVETGALIGVDIATDGHSCTLVAPYLEANATNLRIASLVENTTIVGGWVADATTANITDNGSLGLATPGLWLQYAQTAGRGTDAVASGTTSKAVTHGLGGTPPISAIAIQLTNNPTSNVRHWVSATSSTTFTVSTSADPGASGLAFAWQARLF